MKDFWKFTLATVTGLVLTSVVLSILSILIVVGMVASSSTETVVRDRSVMRLDLSGVVVERSQDNPLRSLFGDAASEYGLDDVISSIAKAKENEKIKGIYLQAGVMSVGFADLEEIRRALADFKESGKFVIAYGDVYEQSIYYLSSVADKILLNPKGMIDWHGLSSTPTFYKNLLDKIGVEMQVFKVGTYKSAVEPYIDTQMSAANREQVTAYLGSLWGKMVDDVSQGRGIDAQELNRIADKMLMFYPAEESVKYGLADTLMYKNDVRDYLKAQMGLTKDDRISLLDVADMVNVKRNVPKNMSGNIVAVYYASGSIDLSTGSSSMSGGIVSSEVIRDLKKLTEDDDVKAVVLRVNSPGGSAFGSEQIWHAVGQLKAKKPVIVSMGNYAASGGYYISCNADTIVAEATTLTGSIGIFGMFPNYKGLSDKLGLTYDVVKTNAYSDFGSFNRPVNNGERQLLQQMINQGYADFIARCSQGRGMTPEAIEKIAEGRVWTGAKAKELGLVDELGGIDRALDIAVAKAGVEEYSVVNYPAKKSFLELLMDKGITKSITAPTLSGKAGELIQQYEWLNHLGEQDRLQALMPYELNIH
jgi:protease-4